MALDDNDLRRLLPIVRRMVREERNTPRAGGDRTLLRPGTVSALASEGDTGAVRLDGDLAAIPVVNLSGNAISANQRVMVLLDPPHGAYVTASLDPTPGVRQLIKEISGDDATLSWTFAVPSWCKWVEIEWFGYSVGAVTAMALRINGDTGLNYNRQVEARNYGSAGWTFVSNNEDRMYILDLPAANEVGTVSGRLGPLNTGTGLYVQCVFAGGPLTGGAANQNNGITRWNASAQVSSLTLLSAVAAGSTSRFRFYGIA